MGSLMKILHTVIKTLQFSEKHPEIDPNELADIFNKRFASHSEYYSTFVDFYSHIIYIDDLNKDIALDRVLDTKPLFNYLYYSTIDSMYATNFLVSYLDFDVENILSSFQFVNIYYDISFGREIMISRDDLLRIANQYLILSLAKFFCKIDYYEKLSTEVRQVLSISELDYIISSLGNTKINLSRKNPPKSLLKTILVSHHKFIKFFWNKHHDILIRFVRNVDEIATEIIKLPELATVISYPLSNAGSNKTVLNIVKTYIFYSHNFYYFVYLMNHNHEESFDSNQLTISIEKIPNIAQIEI